MVTMTVGASSSKGKRKKAKIPLVKHDIILNEVLPEVDVKGSLLGHVDNLKYVDSDVQNLEKFLEFAKEKYMWEAPQTR